MQINEPGYRRLALHVIARAVQDLQRAGSRRRVTEGNGGAPRVARASRDEYMTWTAGEFLSNPNNDRLHLWCGWIQVDPRTVVRMHREGAWRTVRSGGNAIPIRLNSQPGGTNGTRHLTKQRGPVSQ
jgi:hypothetical protein